MLRAYISGALTSVSDRDEVRALYERLADVCERAGVTAYVPHLENDPERHADVPPEVVYERDVAALTSADVVVAYVGAPSLGVGAELALAATSKTPIVAVSRPGQRVSRFIIGMLRQGSSYEIVAEDAELDAALTDALASLTR
jgi:nucleoside 2-deoxyribosyltransferase